MNYDQMKVIVIAKQVGLPIQAKINQIIEAAKDFPGGSFYVPIMSPVDPKEWSPTWPAASLNKAPQYRIVAIPTELYQDEEGNKLLLGYDKEYSILVYKWREADDRKIRHR